jgi:hypothetical protein
MRGTFQSQFSAALLHAAQTPAGLTAWTGAPPDRRFGVYRNNVRAGLAGALASRFPAAVRITGEDFFRAMAAEYALRHPPENPVLMDYGADFPDFVARFPPAAALVYLPDVMRLELARGRAYHAADVPPLDPRRLAVVPEAAVGSLRLAPHPAAAVLRSRHPVLTIWAMNAGERPLGPVAPDVAEDALVTRPALSVRVHPLPPGGAAFLSALIGGACFAEAVEAALAESPDFDTALNLAGALANGVFSGFTLGDLA